MRVKGHHWGAAALGLTALCASLFRLDSVPPVWWDEGWTLSVARNWLELGHYGRLLAGESVPAGLQASPVVTATVSLSFLLFGVGVIQARIVTVLFGLGVLALVYKISKRLYGREVAWGTLVALFVMPSYIELFPIYVGRQVLGEIPALFFLLAGYAAILNVHRSVFWAVSLATLYWTIALSTKLQFLPFWGSAILIPLSVLVSRCNWKGVSYWAVPFGGALVGSRLLPIVWEALLEANTDIAAPISGLYEVTAIVASIPSRLVALIVTVLFGIPTLLGLCYSLWSNIKNRSNLQDHEHLVRLSLLVFAASWFGWFIFFSVGWIRYMFPAFFIGSIFLAAMIYDLTNHFDVSFTLKQSCSVFRQGKTTKQNFAPLLALFLILSSVPRSAMAVFQAYALEADSSAKETARFLNTYTEPNALIETYDSELFFLLNRPYHYPPDGIHVELIRRTFLYEKETRIDYNPLESDPDYLVVGPHSKQWQLYDHILKPGVFRLLQSYSRYKIYERVR